MGAAAEAVGGPALRNMATVGGNVVIGGDVACALLALDATVDLGSRTVPLAELWGGLGMDIVRSVSFNDEAAADSVFVAMGTPCGQLPSRCMCGRGRRARGDRRCGAASRPVGRRRGAPG